MVVGIPKLCRGNARLLTCLVVWQWFKCECCACGGSGSGAFLRLKSAGRKLGVKVVVKTAGKEVGVAFVTTNVCFKCGVRLPSYVCFIPRGATFAARTSVTSEDGPHRIVVMCFRSLCLWWGGVLMQASEAAHPPLP